MDIGTTLSGQVCLYVYELRRKVRVICNPVTGESTTITLREVTAKESGRKCYVGYDPINKQFKVLCTTWSSNGEPTTHRVLTLGSTGKPLWRWIECNPNVSIQMVAYIAGVICINGVVYCGAHYIEGSCMMVCFDFCSEKFSFIKLDEGVLRGTLVNYKGNLGVLGKEDKYQLVLWVLEEDAGNHKWSKSLCVRSRVSLFERIGNHFHILGMTGAGEIVFTTYHSHSSKRFYIVYYNIERNTFTRVYIQGFEQFNDPYITPRIFLDYVENIKLLQVSSSAS